MTGILFALSLWACGAGPTDDAPLADLPWQDRPHFEPTAPAPPTSPALTPCPAGWTETLDPGTGTALCEPWPEGAPPECAEDEMALPGRAACEPIGVTCDAASDWATDVPDDAVFVLAGAAAGGAGTRESPFATIREALAAAPSGATIAVGKGTYDEAIVMSRPATLWGACVAETTVASSEVSTATGTIQARRGVTIRDLSVRGARPGIDVLSGGEETRIESVLVSGVALSGVWVQGTLVADHLAVRDTVGPGIEPGNGLDALGITTVTISESVFEGNEGTGIYVAANLPGAAHDVHVTATDVVLGGGRSTGSGQFGRGLTVQGDLGPAVATLERVVVRGNQDSGLFVSHPGARLEAQDLVVEETRPQDDGFGGGGIVVVEDATAALSRTLVRDNEWIGVYVGRTFEPPVASALDASDLVVLDTRQNAGEPDSGPAVEVVGGAVVTLHRALLARASTVTLLVAEPGSRASGEDVRIADTAPNADGEFGRGAEAWGGGSLDFERVAVSGSHELSVLAQDADTTVSLIDLSISGTLAPASGGIGYGEGDGITVAVGAQATLERFDVSENAFCGVQAAMDGRITATDGRVVGNVIGANEFGCASPPCLSLGAVHFDHNGRNLDSAILPVPEPVDSITP